MVTQNVQKSLQQLHSKARTTLKEVLTTGLKTCEDQQTESPVQISTNIPFKKTDKFRPRIWGNAEFEIQTDWLIGGRQMAVDQTCDELGGAIVITAKYKSQSLPVSVEWSRAYNGILLGDIKVTGNSCPITADDAGCVIKAAITPQRSANLGTAFVEVGPFDMDVSMKQSLLSYLGNKQASFSVDLCDVSSRKLNLVVRPDFVTLRDGTEELCTREIQSSFTMARVDLNDCTIFTLDMSGASALSSSGNRYSGNASSGQGVYRLMTMSQRQRDTIVLAVRIFQALKTTEFSVLMEQVLRNTHQASDQQGGAGDTGTFVATDVDLLLVLELMAMQAVASLEYAHTMEKEKKNAVLERDSLERDINETLQSYQSLIHEIMSNQVDMETLNRHVSQTLSRSVRTSAGSIDLGSLSKHDPPRHDPSRQVNTADYKQLQSQLKESQAKSEAYLKEMEGHRIKLNELQRRLNEKDQQLQELLLNTSHHPAQEPVMNTQKVAQHLNDLNTVTIKDTDNFHDYDRMLNERAKEVDMLRGRVESLTRKCEELTADRDFINKKMTALQAKQRTEGTSPSRQLETMTTIRNKELEMYKANVDELQTKLDRTNREMETIIGRESKLRKECQRLKTELDERTFTKMNQTAFKHGHEQTVLDMDTAGGTALLMQTTTQTAPVDKCLREKDETIRTLQAEADKTKTQNMILTTQNNELKIENKRLNDEVQSLQEKLRKALSSK